jgi:cytochrome c peroxidase
MHNGAFTRLEDAIRHHLDVRKSVRKYNPADAGVAPDLRLGPIEEVLDRIDPLVAYPTHLTKDEFNWLVDFVRNGLLDDGADARHLRRLIPKKVPSGRPVLTFEFPDE